MGKPETFHAWFHAVALPATHGFGLWPKICRRGRRKHSSILKGEKTSSSQFQMDERLKALTMISHKFHVFWRRTMSTGSLFFLCYKTPQQCDNQETMTSCILLVKYYWVFPTFFDEFYSVFFCFFICFPPRWLMKFTSLSGPQSTVRKWLLGELIYKLVVAGQKQ